MFVVILGTLLVFLIIWLKYNLSYWERRGIPGPKPWPFVGNIGAHLIGKCTLGEAIKKIYKKYEDYPFVGLFRSVRPVLLVRDPDLVTLILVKDFKSFHHNEFHLDKKTDPLLSRNPFLMRGEEWKETRHMLTPGLTSGKMKNMYPILRDISSNLVKYIENHPTTTTDGIETRSLAKRLTLDYVAKAAFGIDGKAFEKYDDISEFNKLANRFLSPGSFISIVFGLAQIFPPAMNLMALKLNSTSVQTELIKIVSDVVKYRRENNVHAKDYLQFLMDLAKERNLDDVEITAHASTLFLDGYETASLILSLFLLNLARHPQYQTKIREEIQKCERENGGELTYEAVHEMTWLNACLYESFRYTPAIDIFTKICTESYQYTPKNPDFKNITLKLVPGDIVVIPYGYLPTDEKYFENANKFMPERFLTKESTDKSLLFPFSNGPRACIGQRLGIMQVKLGAATVLRSFELSVSPKLQQPIKYIPYHPINEVQGGVWIRYKKIE